MPRKVFTHISMKRLINGSFSLRASPQPCFPLPAGGRGRELISNFARPVAPRIKTHWPTLTVMLAHKCSFPELYSRRPQTHVVYNIYGSVRCNFPDLAMHAGAKEKVDHTHCVSHLSFLRFEENHPARWMKTNDGLSNFAIRSARRRSLRVKRPGKIDCAKVGA